MLLCVGAALAQDPWPGVSDGQAPDFPYRHADTSLSAHVLPWVIRKIPLGDVSFAIRGGMEAETCVKFSPNGRRLAIGTMTGRLMVVDVYSGKTLWDKTIPEGIVKHLAFAPDGASLYYGEQSTDGLIAAVDAETGEPRWQYRMADDLESSPPPAKDDPWGRFTLPGCYQLKTLEDGDVVALGIHAWGDFNDYTTQRRASKVYRFAPDGSVRWAFPADRAAPMTLVYADADPGGRRVAVLTGTPSGNAGDRLPAPTGSVIVLDGATGKPLGHYTFPPLKPWFDFVAFWQSVSVGKDGKRASIGMNDGRTCLFDLDTLKPTQMFTFGVPIVISGVPVSARSTFTKLAPDGFAYFQTAASSVPNADSSQQIVAPPGPHPYANTIHVVDPTGKLAWRYRSGHTYQNFWFDRTGRWMLTCVKKEAPDGEPDSGAMLFDTNRPGGGTAKLCWYYQVKGITYFLADMAPDGSAVAIVEMPVKLPQSSRLLGTYQVHVVR